MKKIGCIILSVMLLSLFWGCKPAEKPVEEVKHEIHWGYEGEGSPANWGTLKPEFAVCGSGMSQSPIDIDRAIKASLDKIVFSYKETPVKIINNGHSIQVNYEPGSSITVDGQTYELIQFHFHAPSEHALKGKLLDMELHLVHKNDRGELAVVGVFLKKGAPNKVIKVLWDNIPKEINKENIVDGIAVNASAMLPSDSGYYHYYGSLTTPPCTEGVN